MQYNGGRENHAPTGLTICWLDLMEVHTAISRLALKIVVMTRQEARVKKFSAILRFFTQFGFIVFTYLTNSGNTKSNISDREQVISALQLIWEDLVRALISERILRDNKRLLANNQDLVVNNLANLQPLQVSS